MPTAVNMVTVRAEIRDPVTSLPAQGVVRFHLPYALRDVTDHILFGNTRPIVAALVDGIAVFEAPANDSAGVSPQGFAYTIEIDTDVMASTFFALLPSSPNDVHLSDLVPVLIPPPVGVPGGGIVSISSPDSSITVGGNSTAKTVVVAAGVQSAITAAASAASAAQATASAAYVKPGPGIPSGDLTSAVQSELALAFSAYQKPGGGVPESDLAAAVVAKLAAAVSALQIAPADPAALAYLCHTANYDPFIAAQNSPINEQWFMRILVRAGRQINLVKTLVRTAGTAGAGGLNGFSLYSDDFTTKLWESASDDTMWLAAGEVSKAVTGSLAGLTNRTPAVDTWFRVSISARGHTAAPGFPFANFSGSSALTDAGNYRCRYRAATAYSAWPASIVPASDLAGVTGFVPPVLIG